MRSSDAATESLRTSILSLITRYASKPVTVVLTIVIVNTIGVEGFGQLVAFNAAAALAGIGGQLVTWYVFEKKKIYLAAVSAVSIGVLVYLYFVGGIWLVAASLSYILLLYPGTYVSLTIGTLEPSKLTIFGFVKSLIGYGLLTLLVVLTHDYRLPVVVEKYYSALLITGLAVYAYQRGYTLPDKYLRGETGFKFANYFMNVASTVVWGLLYPFFNTNPIEASALRAAGSMRFGFTDNIVRTYMRQTTRSDKKRDEEFERSVAILSVVENTAVSGIAPFLANIFYGMPITVVAKYSLITGFASITGNIIGLRIAALRLAYNPKPFFWRRVAAQVNNILWLSAYWFGDLAPAMVVEGYLDYALSYTIGAHRFLPLYLHALIAPLPVLALVYPSPLLAFGPLVVAVTTRWGDVVRVFTRCTGCFSRGTRV